MARKEATKLVVIGGSWGGMQASISILQELPESFPLPIWLVLHRQKNQQSELHLIYRKKLALQVQEIEEKQALEPGCVYLAPANYHVLLENDLSFSLDSSEAVNFSRPSIDVSFRSAARVMGSETLGILLSGASSDGSRGLKEIDEKGGDVLIQDPAEAEAKVMPNAAKALLPNARILTLRQIQAYLLSLSN